MKKKLLSLVLAGAMVATTSVSAFASPNVTAQDNTEPTTNIQITGDVQSKTGETKPGTFNVTVPTAANFTVDKDGKFIGTTIDINNAGTQNVDIYAHAFTDTTNTDEINVVSDSSLASAPRTSVSLNIKGNAGIAYLGTASGSERNGIYSDKELTTSTTDVRLASISSGGDATLTLDGKAGQDGNPIENAVRDTFTLVLKVKKSK